jgi:hypothetical protein
VPGYCLAGRFYLATGDPAFIQCFDAERSKSKLMATLGVAFHAAFLLLPEFSFLWL